MKTDLLLEKNRNILNMISHDIKSPLNGILGFASLIAEESFSVEHKKMALQIEKAGKDILFLVNNIMAMVKMEAGKEIPDFRWVPDLHEEMIEILQTFSVEAHAKKIKLELEMPEPVTQVYWDMEKLRFHVLNNLISNSLKFTPNGGIIRLTVTRIGETARIVVADNGPGIPWIYREKVFEPYSHIDGNRASRQREGYGLGLYNARLFVEYHDGIIYLAGNEDNNAMEEFVSERTPHLEKLNGARFIIELPFFPENIHPFSSVRKI